MPFRSAAARRPLLPFLPPPLPSPAPNRTWPRSPPSSRRWSQAFLARDFAFLEEVVAPEFMVAGWRGGRYASTERARWFENARRWEFREHPTEVLHVRVIGDVAVATVRGRLVAAVDGRIVRDNPFVVTDTWLRRNGRWQVVFRYADDISEAGPGPVAGKSGG